MNQIENSNYIPNLSKQLIIGTTSSALWIQCEVFEANFAADFFVLIALEVYRSERYNACESMCSMNTESSF